MRTLIAMHIMMLAAAASICRPLPLRPLHHFSKRCQSGGTGFQLLSWFSTVPSATFLERGLLLAHDAGGCWSLELVACTAAARLLMSSVTMTYIRRLFTRYAMTMHPVNQKEKQLRKEVAQQLAVGSLSPLMARDVKLKEIARLRAQSRELIEQQNIHPGKGFVMVGLEAVFWLSYAVAVRNITAGFPAEWAAVAQQDMGSQGAFWFPDLTLPDPYVLPLIASSTLLFSVQVSHFSPSCVFATKCSKTLSQVAGRELNKTSPFTYLSHSR